MPELVEVGTMAREDKAVKIESDIWREAKRAAEHRGLDMRDYISNLLRDRVHQDYLAAVEAEYRAVQKAVSRAGTEAPSSRSKRKRGDA